MKTVGTHLGSYSTTKRAGPAITNELQIAKILL